MTTTLHTTITYTPAADRRNIWGETVDECARRMIAEIVEHDERRTSAERLALGSARARARTHALDVAQKAHEHDGKAFRHRARGLAAMLDPVFYERVAALLSDG